MPTTKPELHVKQVIWVGSSHEELKNLPPSVCRAVGYALYQVQKGEKPLQAKVLSGMGSANIQEIRENDKSGTYRVIYTLEMGNYLFVLHAFQKKSKSGIATPKRMSTNWAFGLWELFATFHIDLLDHVLAHGLRPSTGLKSLRNVIENPLKSLKGRVCRHPLLKLLI